MKTKLDEFYSFLQSIANQGVRTSLDRIREATEILGLPQKNFKVVHIAGTNGKGSSCYFLAQMLSKSGYRVGLAISPHITNWKERIQFSAGDGHLHLIDDYDLVEIFARVRSALGVDFHLTYFEWGVLLALEYFRFKQVEYAVLETGLGGRWDATNICDSILSGITTIGLDHVQILGDTKEKILSEKLEIMKPNSSFLFAPEDEKLIELAKKKASLVHAEFHQLSDWDSSSERIMKEIESFQSPRIFRSYLRESLKFSITALEVLKTKAVSTDVASLLKSFVLMPPPVRMQILSEAPLVLVDGAHNEMGLVALKGYVDREFPQGYDLVFGCLYDRDFLQLADLMRSANMNYWCLFDSDRPAPKPVYDAVVDAFGGDIVALNEDFFNRLKSSPSKRPIIVCGSLYLCAQFLEFWRKYSI